MIKANHRIWAHRIFQPYIMRLMRRHFHAMYLQGDYPRIPHDLPILMLPNHCSWWDGFFIYFLNLKLFSRPLYLMMLENQLQKYRFFSKVGAYSIQPGSPKSVLESLTYSREILETLMIPAPLICLFPQGELKPAGIRPLGIKNGYDWLLRKFKGKLIILPIAMKLEFLDQQRPEVFFRFGTPSICDQYSYPSSEQLEKLITDPLDQIVQNLLTYNRGEKLLSGSLSINERWNRFRRKINRSFRS